MDKKTVSEVINEWCELYNHTNLEPLIDHYKKKYEGQEIIDYAIEGNTIFITLDTQEDVKITFVMDSWEDKF